MYDRYLQTFPKHAKNLLAGKANGSAYFADPSGVDQTVSRNLAFAASWQDWDTCGQPVTSIKNKSQAKDTADSQGTRFTGKNITGNNDLERFEKKSQTSSKAIMVTDDQGIITYVNPAFERITGYSQAEAAGKPASLLKSGLHEHSFYMDLWSALADGREFQALFANRRKNGEIYFEEKCIRPFVRHGKTSYFVAVGHPLSDYLQATLLRLSRQANHDPLTELPNRNLFLDRLHQHFSRASRYGTRFALAYLDLDNFKTINDTLGHDAGDIALKAAAQHIQNSLRDEDTVGRLGGDEFGLILSNIQDENDVRRTLEKVLSNLSQGAIYEGQLLTIKASIGAILYPDGGKDSESMMRQADRIMYACKLSGGNGLHIHRAEQKPSSSHEKPTLPQSLTSTEARDKQQLALR